MRYACPIPKLGTEQQYVLKQAITMTAARTPHYNLNRRSKSHTAGKWALVGVITTSSAVTGCAFRSGFVLDEHASILRVPYIFHMKSLALKL